jgi:hypothetical protein
MKRNIKPGLLIASLLAFTSFSGCIPFRDRDSVVDENLGLDSETSAIAEKTLTEIEQAKREEERSAVLRQATDPAVQTNH